jgi:hypothetical protein
MFERPKLRLYFGAIHVYVQHKVHEPVENIAALRWHLSTTSSSSLSVWLAGGSTKSKHLLKN